jgi:hypothetical protein
LVSSSDTTIAMSWTRSAVPHRRRVRIVKSRAARTDPASAAIVRVAISGMRTLSGAGAGRRAPYTRPAISAASVSHRKPTPSARRADRAFSLR